MVILFGVCGLLWVAPSRGAERTVRVTIAAPPAEASGLEAVFAELLARLHVSIQATNERVLDAAAIAAPKKPTPELLAHVWVDLTRRGAATLYLLDVATDRLLVRKIRRDPGGGELVQEELGHILQTSVEGLLAGELVGVPRHEILPLLEPPAQPSTRTENESPASATGSVASPTRAESSLRRDRRASLADAPASRGDGPASRMLGGHAVLLYGAALFGPDVPIVHGPTLGAFAHTGGKLELGLWLSLQLRLPVEASNGPVSARFSQLSPRALFGLRLVGDAERALRFGIGGGVDLVRVETHSQPEADVRVVDPATRAFAIGRAGLLFDWRFSGALRFVGELDVDIDSSATRYVYLSRTGERVLLEPYVLRPALALGVATP
ncbi:MAG TPA: hypothetical protein VFQ61_25850 [Polyangiaceae bacterium]|nr:hypothetical protein [Polyangiaceae bacterium]